MTSGMMLETPMFSYSGDVPYTKAGITSDAYSVISPAFFRPILVKAGPTIS